jgi:cholesterol oxidase
MSDQEHFDFVVIGSGFGASTAAYRLAEADNTVCVLERGRPYPPGSFARSPRDMARNLWDPRSGLFGMFDIWSFRGIESLVSSGLGGGSLIYANVLIRKDPNWFVNDMPGGQSEPWPVTYDDLALHYGRAEKMLGAQRYPFDSEPYCDTPKTLAMKHAATCLGLDWRLPNLAVTFANPGRPPVPGECIEEEFPNLHGRTRDTCRLCGECDIGCNYGSKNTLDYNYLSAAKRHGAELRTLAEVFSIEPRQGGGYTVAYVQHNPDKECQGVASSALARTVVTADQVVLGAGTFGSTYLLLRNRSALPGLSSTLGSHFSGNGDLLAFLRHSRQYEDGVSVPEWLNPEFGPVITSAIRMPDSLDEPTKVGRGFYIEDGGNPQFLNWLVETTGAAKLAARATRFLVGRVLARIRDDPKSNLSGDISALVGNGEASSTFLPLLAMGRDIPDGVMRLRDGDLELDWSTRSSSAYFDRVERTLDQIADALGARLMNSPLWLFKRVITVHPLGGCPMGADHNTGVVNDHGEVFGYKGLHVVDGSVMPGPVGPNPSLTIAAFADRAADRMLS